MTAAKGAEEIKGTSAAAEKITNRETAWDVFGVEIHFNTEGSTSLGLTAFIDWIVK